MSKRVFLEQMGLKGGRRAGEEEVVTNDETRLQQQQQRNNASLSSSQLYLPSLCNHRAQLRREGDGRGPGRWGRVEGVVAVGGREGEQ